MQVTNHTGYDKMTEERITRHTDEEGHTHTTHTVVSDAGSRGGGTTAVLVILAIAAILVAVYFFGNMSNAEIAKDAAIGNAANEVGAAANQAGEAIDQAADRVAPAE